MDLLGNLANLKVDTVLSAVDKYVPGAQNKIKNLADKAKAYVNNVSELELKVLEATNHDPWGPHGSVMQEITNNSFHSEGFYQIMGVVDQRLQESPENWRLVYKALLLLEYMVKHGPMSVSEALLSYSRLAHLEKLRDRFEFKEASGRDQGVNVRQRAGALVSLVQDSKQLAEERDKAAKNKAKYTGVSSSSMRYGGFGAGGSSGSTGSYSTSRAYASSDSFGSSSMGTGAGGGGYGSSSMGAGGYGSSSSYRRSSSGAGGGGVPSDSTAAAGGVGAGGADPVEATRQRIARLKAEGALPAGAAGAGADGDSPGGGPGFDGDGLSPKSNKPKKLSEIKINPAISATFAKGAGLAPPPGASKGGSSSSTGAAAAASGIDLLGDLDVSPAPPAAGAAAAAAPKAGAGLDEWNGFAGAPGTTAAAAAAAGGADEWAAFDSAPPAGSKPKQQVDINSLLGPLPTATAAATSSGPSGKGPLPLDDFCDIPTPAPAFAAAPAAAPVPAAAASAAAPPAQQPAAAGFDPFSGASAAPAAAGAGNSSGSDPFAASGSVHLLPQAPKQQHGAAAAAANGAPKLGPETAKAKDPFADLAFI